MARVGGTSGKVGEVGLQAHKWAAVGADGGRMDNADRQVSVRVPKWR